MRSSREEEEFGHGKDLMVVGQKTRMGVALISLVSQSETCMVAYLKDVDSRLPTDVSVSRLRNIQKIERVALYSR